MQTEQQKQEALEWDLQAYGCSSDKLRRRLDSHIGDYLMLVAGLMSDAQEEISMNMPEMARQTLNRAKFILFNYVMNEGA